MIVRHKHSVPARVGDAQAVDAKLLHVVKSIPSSPFGRDYRAGAYIVLLHRRGGTIADHADIADIPHPNKQAVVGDRNHRA